MSRRPDRPLAFYAGVTCLGFASGLRSQVGLATICSGTPTRSLPGILRSRFARRSAVVLALAELAADKLPSVPDRTEPAGLLARLTLGGTSGGLAARGMGFGPSTAVVLGSLASLTGAFAGLAGRRMLGSRMPAVRAGVVEDGVALVISAVGLRSARS